MAARPEVHTICAPLAPSLAFLPSVLSCWQALLRLVSLLHLVLESRLTERLCLALTASKDLTRACTGARAELSCACAPSQAACLGGNVRAAYHDLCCVRERANHPAYQVADELS